MGSCLQVYIHRNSLFYNDRYKVTLFHKSFANPGIGNIGVATIAHKTHVHNEKNLHIEGRSQKGVKLLSHTIRDFS